ncbi:hypothetical protein ACSBR1_009670 [Camellia fascicularis]
MSVCAQMDAVMMLLCCYRSTNSLVCLAHAFRLQLIDVILKQRWVKVSSPIVDEQLTSNPNVHDGMNSLNGMDMDDELDLLPTFYPHTEKVFLSALWANGFTHIGHHFEGGASEFRIVPLTWPTEVILDLKEDYGLDITYRVVWLGVEKARGELFGAYSVSFNQLRWYNNAVIEHNLGSYINLEYDNRNH